MPLTYSGTIFAEPGLRSYWPMQELTGTVADDITATNVNGTYTGGFVLNNLGYPGLGTGVRFNGLTGFVDTLQQSIASPISVECWFNTGWTYMSGTLVEKLPPNQQWGLKYESNYIKWHGGSAFAISGLAPSINRWHHIVATQSGVFGKIFIDGALATTGNGVNLAAIGNLNTSNNHIRVASSGIGGGFISGVMQHLAIYTTQLTPAVILNHYRAGVNTYGDTPLFDTDGDLTQFAGKKSKAIPTFINDGNLLEQGIKQFYQNTSYDNAGNLFYTGRRNTQSNLLFNNVVDFGENDIRSRISNFTVDVSANVDIESIKFTVPAPNMAYWNSNSNDNHYFNPNYWTAGPLRLIAPNSFANILTFINDGNILPAFGLITSSRIVYSPSLEITLGGEIIYPPSQDLLYFDNNQFGTQFFNNNYYSPGLVSTFLNLKEGTLSFVESGDFTLEGEIIYPASQDLIYFDIGYYGTQDFNNNYWSPGPIISTINPQQATTLFDNSGDLGVNNVRINLTNLFMDNKGDLSLLDVRATRIIFSANTSGDFTENDIKLVNSATPFSDSGDVSVTDVRKLLSQLLVDNSGNLNLSSGKVFGSTVIISAMGDYTELDNARFGSTISVSCAGDFHEESIAQNTVFFFSLMEFNLSGDLFTQNGVVSSTRPTFSPSLDLVETGIRLISTTETMDISGDFSPIIISTRFSSVAFANEGNILLNSRYLAGQRLVFVNSGDLTENNGVLFKSGIIIDTGASFTCTTIKGSLSNINFNLAGDYSERSGKFSSNSINLSGDFAYTLSTGLKSRSSISLDINGDFSEVLLKYGGQLHTSTGAFNCRAYINVGGAVISPAHLAFSPSGKLTVNLLGQRPKLEYIVNFILKGPRVINIYLKDKTIAP